MGFVEGEEKINSVRSTSYFKVILNKKGGEKNEKRI